MFLDINADYEESILPFLKNGIIIDTSVLKIIVDGIVTVKISKKPSPDLDKILNFLDLIKIKNKWNRFYITPHILTEVCTHLRNDHKPHERIIQEVFPIIKEMNERLVEKTQIIDFINGIERPLIELGDISIFIIADDIKTNGKIAILAKDGGISQRYKDDPRVMIMDYVSIINNKL